MSSSGVSHLSGTAVSSWQQRMTENVEDPFALHRERRKP